MIYDGRLGKERIGAVGPVDDNKEFVLKDKADNTFTIYDDGTGE